MKMRRKLPRVKQVRTRKGNQPSNPYTAEATTALPLEDRAGYPFAARKADLSDDAQLGVAAVAEPVYVLRASSPFSGMVLRFMANASVALDIADDEAQQIRQTALAMDEWREKNSRAG